jgi:putative membrane protein
MKTNQPTLLSLAVVLGACGHAQPAKSPDSMSTPVSNAAAAPAPADPAAGISTIPLSATPTAGSGMVADNTAGAPEAQPTLTDNQILGFTHAANAGEIEQGRLAQRKAKDSKVKAFAAMMVKEHTDADNKGQALAKKANLKPEPSPTTESLKTGAEAATSTLKSEMGADFDRSYVDTQVKEHQDVLDTLDQKLIPSATNADLKTYLADVRAAVAMHLQHAEDLQKQMK